MTRLTATADCERGLVSIVMPTYRGAHSVGRAIESVLAQEYRQFELIVVDDNPPESLERRETQELMERYLGDDRIRYVRHSKNMNGSAARNTGINSSVGEYLTFLDDDDVMMPNRLGASVTGMTSLPDASMLFCDILHVYDNAGHMNLYVMNPADLTPAGILLNEAAVGTGSNLFCRRDVVLAVDGFDTRFRRHQDLEFSIRMLEFSPRVAIVHDPLVIKGYNGVSNVPAYQKLKEVKELYSSVFAHIIVGFSDADASVYWRKLHMSLYRSALRADDYDAACYHLKEAVKWDWSKGLKESAQLLLCRLGLFSSFVRDGKTATITNGTNAELTHPEVWAYYMQMADLAAQKG